MKRKSRILVNILVFFIFITALSRIAPLSGFAVFDDISDTFPDVSSDIDMPTILTPGDNLLILEQTESGLSIVRLNGEVGIMRFGYLDIHPEAISSTIPTMSNADLRTIAPHNSGINNTLLPGTSVDVLSNSPTGLTMIQVNGVLAYVYPDIYNIATITSLEDADTTSQLQYSFFDELVVELLDWTVVRELIPINEPIQVIDVRTFRTYNIICFSMYDHADVEPVTKDDTDIMFEIRDGIRSWDARPVWVLLGDRLVAASLHGMPHGSQQIHGNGIIGHLCLHFKGSTTTSPSRAYREDLQNAVNEAWDTYINLLRFTSMSIMYEE